jgi:hypothetical protein
LLHPKKHIVFLTLAIILLFFAAESDISGVETNLKDEILFVQFLMFCAG